MQLYSWSSVRPMCSSNATSERAFYSSILNFSSCNWRGVSSRRLIQLLCLILGFLRATYSAPSRSSIALKFVRYPSSESFLVSALLTLTWASLPAFTRSTSSRVFPLNASSSKSPSFCSLRREISCYVCWFFLSSTTASNAEFIILWSCFSMLLRFTVRSRI